MPDLRPTRSSDVSRTRRACRPDSSPSAALATEENDRAVRPVSQARDGNSRNSGGPRRKGSLGSARSRRGAPRPGQLVCAEIVAKRRLRLVGVDDLVIALVAKGHSIQAIEEEPGHDPRSQLA